MSDVIVRMEMPDWCPCELAIDNNGWFSPCFAYDGIPSREKEFDDCVKNRKRPSWCPIKGVLPDEHGDLIDRDKAKDAFDSSFLTFRMKDGETMRGFYQRTIAELPTVIAAERKDDENH